MFLYLLETILKIKEDSLTKSFMKIQLLHSVWMLKSEGIS